MSSVLSSTLSQLTPNCLHLGIIVYIFSIDEFKYDILQINSSHICNWNVNFALFTSQISVHCITSHSSLIIHHNIVCIYRAASREVLLVFLENLFKLSRFMHSYQFLFSPYVFCTNKQLWYLPIIYMYIYIYINVLFCYKFKQYIFKASIKSNVELHFMNKFAKESSHSIHFQY